MADEFLQRKLNQSPHFAGSSFLFFVACPRACGMRTTTRSRTDRRCRSNTSTILTQNFTAVPANHVLSRVAMNGPLG